VQFLQGKSIQQEFCHTLNALIDAGRQVVVAADRPPGDLESLEERVRSRLSGGLCVEMGGLDEHLRQRILDGRIAIARQTQPGFKVPPAVVSYVARAIETNGRDLEGAVSRLLARATLTGTALTVESAEDAIRDLVRTREPKRVKIEDIQKLVATHYNVSKADILSSRRTATVVRPRQIAMYLSKVLTLRSLPEIGRRFGGRDHTTVLHAVRKIEGLANKDGSLSEEIELLKRMLTD
jgi:chromosomal replication initiator protein